MSKEIGSEFWEIPISNDDNKLFPKSTEWFISGRSALRAIIRENKFRTVALPVWCCDSIITPFLDCGIEVLFYDREAPKADAILVMDYFGYSSGVTWENFGGIVIRDVTHSICSKTYNDADYYFGSLRKWAGFLTGGFAWGFKRHVEYSEGGSDYIELRKQAMRLKQKYITGETDSKEYLNIFAEAEEKLEQGGILSASELDINKARHLDVDFIKNRRQSNSKILIDAFQDIAIFSSRCTRDCPMFVPIRVKKRDELRKYLINHEIYCPVHWPISKYHALTKERQDFYNEELSLVCDQRYSEDDMKRIVSVIEKFFVKGCNKCLQYMD